ncbi:MAG: hypothetical protein U0W40_01660 [Acidimicrobiia bacterium]
MANGPAAPAGTAPSTSSGSSASALQSRRFSLAAIRALLEREEPGALEGLLAGNDDAYEFDELVGTAAVPPKLARDLIDVGLLREPADHGRATFDGDDLSVLRAFSRHAPRRHPRRHARGAGAPLRLHVRRPAAPPRRPVHGIEHPVVRRRSGRRAPEQATMTAPGAARMARDMRVISDYTLQRNLQRQVLLALEHHADIPEHTAADETA